MVCRHCGAQIEDNSQFCSKCGKALTTASEQTVPVSPAVQPSVASPAVSAAPLQKPSKGPKIWLVLLLVAGFVGGIFLALSMLQGTASKSEITRQTNALYERVTGILDQAVPEEIRTLIDYQIYPERDQFTMHRAKANLKGTYTYTDSEGNAMTKPFEMEFFMLKEKMILLYADYDGYITRNIRDAISGMGLVTAEGASQYSDVTLNEPMFELDMDPEQLAMIQVRNDSLITLDEYNQIEPGMYYYEIVDIIGSYGECTVNSSVAGIDGRLYSWKGSGKPGSSASLDFVNGKLMAKAQYGLD